MLFFTETLYIVWRQSHSVLKDSRSRNNIVELKLLPKNKQTNLLFYPDDWEIIETWISISSVKYFQVIRIEKKNLFVCFLDDVTAQQFYFEIYWPLG